MNLELNDNRKYTIERYKSEIMGFIGAKQERPKERLTSKRHYMSHRASNHKSAYSLHNNLSKLTKATATATVRPERTEIKHKQHQSAHISPNVEKSIEKLTTNARRNILKVSERLTTDLRKGMASRD